MKEYQTPVIEEEVVILEDIIAVSGTIGTDYAGDNDIDPLIKKLG